MERTLSLRCKVEASLGTMTRSTEYFLAAKPMLGLVCAEVPWVHKEAIIVKDAMENSSSLENSEAAPTNAEDTKIAPAYVDGGGGGKFNGS